jgi:uncharacterized protein YhaN
MRIAQLDLKAFGPFTGRRIELPATPDFHLAYGPNEAGKSTISRALRGALFGIPERTGDNHLHAYEALRVGLVLESPGGERLAAMRRKARKNSLVRYDPATGEELGEAIPEETLGAWLGGLTEGLYTSMFGLDHDELVAGGRALSEGKGEVGASLFEAGTGLAGIRTLRERLATEADELFRPRAPTSTIYRVLDQYGKARREAKDAQTRPAEWEALRMAAEEAIAAHEATRGQQEGLQREARRLERLAAVLPDVAARTLALDRLAALGPVTRLPADAAARRIEAQTRLRQAQAARAEAAARRERLGLECAAIELPQALLEEAGAIEAVYYSVKPFRAARAAAAGAQGKLDQAEARTGSLLRAMGATESVDPRGLIPPATLRARVQGLATQGAKLGAERAAAARQAAEAARELAELDSELKALGPRQAPAALLDLLKGLESEGNPETRAAEQGRQAAQAQAELERDAAALDSGSVDDLVALVPPLPAQIQGLRLASEGLDARTRSLRERIETLEDDAAAVAGEIQGLVQGGEPVTAEQLARLRAVRESLWQRIRARLYPADTTSADPGPDSGSDSGSEPGPDPVTLPAPGEYELAVQGADAAADARFGDAARVSQYAELHKRLAQMHRALDLERGRLAATEAERAQWQADWQGLLQRHRLPPLGLAELGDWLGRLGLFLQSHRAWQQADRQARDAAGRASSWRSRLAAALVECGLAGCPEPEPLAEASARLRAFVDLANRAAASHKVLGQKRQRAAARLAEAEIQGHQGEEALATWSAAWTAAMAEIRVGAEAGAEEAGVRLAQFEELERALDTRDAARAELGAARTTLERVEQETARLCQATGYDRGERPADAVAETLFERLAEAKTLAQHRKTLEDLIGGATQAGRDAERDLGQAEADLDALKTLAGCATLEALPEAEQRSAEAARLESEVAGIEERLVLASALSLPGLLEQAKGQDLALVKAALEQVGADLEASTAIVESLHARRIEAQGALDRVDGAAVAAAAEQRAAEAAAQLSHRVAAYASARLASAILAEVIETYQQRHQGPLLARASQLFETITGGRFARVATDFDESMTILVAVRPTGRREKVGSLSSGTRDQLFLALRLAAIERQVAGQGPMPLVVDDIVINFDDASAAATFRVLAGLSHRTQVLFFTHHQHLLERAAEAVGAGAFVAHRL